MELSIYLCGPNLSVFLFIVSGISVMLHKGAFPLQISKVKSSMASSSLYMVSSLYF